MEKQAVNIKWGLVAAFLMLFLAIFSTVVGATWVIRGDIKDNAVAIAELRVKVEGNTASITELRDEFRGDIAGIRADIDAIRRDVAELRGALLSHISGHNHAPVIADGEKDAAN